MQVFDLPAIYYNRAFAESGGLIAYSDDFTEQFRQAAGYINRILRGSKVGELPIQQPTKFELGINMKTAKARAKATMIRFADNRLSTEVREKPEELLAQKN